MSTRTRRSSVALLIALSMPVLGISPASAAEATIDLDDAEDFAVLAATTVTDAGSSVIDGEIGVSPGNTSTGFPPGTVHLADQEANDAQDSVGDAYDDADSRTDTALGSNQLNGRILDPGVYSGGALDLAQDGVLTLDAGGDPSAVFIITAASSLTINVRGRVALDGGAQACNVFWRVVSDATLGVDSEFVGTILALNSITANTNATVEGRLLAQEAAVTLDDNVITVPTCLALPGGGGGAGGGGGGGGIQRSTTTTSTAPTTSTTVGSTPTPSSSGGTPVAFALDGSPIYAYAADGSPIYGFAADGSPIYSSGAPLPTPEPTPPPTPTPSTVTAPRPRSTSSSISRTPSSGDLPATGIGAGLPLAGLMAVAAGALVLGLSGRRGLGKGHQR